MRYPKFLEDGGTIGFVAPSFGCNIEPYRSCFDNALKRFKERGYNTLLGPNCYKGEGVGISNTPEKCGAELVEMYKSPDSDVIISCGGGELMCEVLPFIEWESLKQAEPKWYLGYSDNTNFTYLSTILMDTAAIYGPCAPSFGTEPLGESLEDAFSLLTGRISSVHNYEKWEKESLKDEEHPLVPYNLTEPFAMKIFPEKERVSFEGRLIGGCVDCLVNLLGTRFDKTADFLEKYKEDGFIWFLECCDLNPMSMRRAFFQMKEAGWFKYAKGFLIGRPLHFGEEMMGVDQYNAVTAIIGELGVPIIMDLDIGHLPPQMPLISGAMAEVTAGDNAVQIDYKYI
ncbi:Muramoyltetrapeptide carboxypeptidase LdcA (peptidoglycan recycling) [Eubacterium ruminantium]|nr:Muramoyltetrapeptide carboxypeptidase LdcA (peptidoglycan recycling) [Eubacterium ruminantium]